MDKHAVAVAAHEAPEPSAVGSAHARAGARRLGIVYALSLLSVACRTQDSQPAPSARSEAPASSATAAVPKAAASPSQTAAPTSTGAPSIGTPSTPSAAPAASGSNAPAASQADPNAPCVASGEVVLASAFGKLGTAAAFAYGIDGGDQFGPQSIVLSPDGRTLSIFDSAQQRVSSYELGGASARLKSTVQLPERKVITDFAWLAGGRLALLEGRDARVSFAAANGKVEETLELPELSLQMVQAARAAPGANRSVFVQRGAALWVTLGRELVPVLDATGAEPAARDKLPGFPAPSPERLASITPTKDEEALDFARVDKGKVGTPHRLTFPLSLRQWLAPESDAQGRLYLVTTHEPNAKSESRKPPPGTYPTLLSVLSPELELAQQLELPPLPYEYPRSRLLAVAADGTLYYLAGAADGIKVLRFAPSAGRYACGSAS